MYFVAIVANTTNILKYHNISNVFFLQNNRVPGAAKVVLAKRVLNQYFKD
jgi:hypothetical protein